jgi:hypothetical protein
MKEMDDRRSAKNMINVSVTRGDVNRNIYP